MTQPASDLRDIPLHALHAAKGARFGAFAGFRMPIQYPAGLRAEHLHTRASASLFDVSHMGQLRARARDGRRETLHAQLEAALPVDFADWPDLQQRYSLLLNDAGGIDDDLMLVHLVDGDSTEVRIVANAGNRDADLARLRALCPALEIDEIDAALVALQGPQAEAVLAQLDPACASMRFLQARTLSLLGTACFTTRSGYTGEDGFEISLPAASTEAFARALLAQPEVKPVGLGARNSLRLEASLCLYGNDIDTSTTPVEASLGWAIQKVRRTGGERAGGFPGAARVLAQIDGSEPVTRKRVGLVALERVPVREHTELRSTDGQSIGEVTSGLLGPTAGKPVALGYVTPAHATVGTRVNAIVRGKAVPMEVSATPFVPNRYVRG